MEFLDIRKNTLSGIMRGPHGLITSLEINRQIKVEHFEEKVEFT